MFCKNCGKEIKDSARFCQFCGTPVDGVEENTGAAAQEPDDGLDEYYGKRNNEAPKAEEVKEEAPKKKHKKGFIAAVMVIAAIVVVSVICAIIFIFGKTDVDRLQDAAKKTETALANRTDITKYAVGYLQADQVGATVKIDDLSEIISAIYPEASGIAGAISGDIEASAAIDRKGGASAYFNLDIMGVTATAGYYKTEAGESDIVFDMPILLTVPYGFSLDTLNEDFKNSVFSPDSSTDYSLSEDDYSEFENILCIVQEITSYITINDINELATLIEDSKETKIDFKPDKTSVYTGDEEVTADAYKATITTTMIQDILNFSASWLEKKVDLSDYGISVTDAVNSLADEIAELDLRVNVELDVYNGYIVRIAVDEESYDAGFEMLLGSDPSVTQHVTCAVTYEGEDMLTADLNLENAADNDFALEITDYYGEKLVIYANYDKDASEFNISLDANSGAYTFVIKGDMTISDTAMSVSNMTVSVDSDAEVSLPGLSAELTTKPTIRKLSDDFPSGYTNVLTLDEDSIESLIETISGNLYSLINLFG